MDAEWVLKDWEGESERVRAGSDAGLGATARVEAARAGKSGDREGASRRQKERPFVEAAAGKVRSRSNKAPARDAAGKKERPGCASKTRQPAELRSLFGRYCRGSPVRHAPTKLARLACGSRWAVAGPSEDWAGNEEGEKGGRATGKHTSAVEGERAAAMARPDTDRPRQTSRRRGCQAAWLTTRGPLQRGVAGAGAGAGDPERLCSGSRAEAAVLACCLSYECAWRCVDGCQKAVGRRKTRAEAGRSPFLPSPFSFLRAASRRVLRLGPSCRVAAGACTSYAAFSAGQVGWCLVVCGLSRGKIERQACDGIQSRGRPPRLSGPRTRVPRRRGP